MAPESPPHILVIGAGPIGLEAAVLLAQSGFTVTVAERGQEVAASVRHWGQVRLFSKNEINTTAWGRAACAEVGTVPDAAAYPTGDEFSTTYLELLASWLAASPQVSLLTATTVVALSRGTILKNEQVMAVGETDRTSTPFHALLCSGAEEEFVVDGLSAVLDCSGTYGNGNAIGAGGAPALGERPLRSRQPSAIFADGLPDVLGRDAATFTPPSGGVRRVFLVGSGYSAATTLLALVEAGRQHPEGEMHIEWCLRSCSGRTPYASIPDDPLPARASLVDLANQMAEGEAPLPPNVTLHVRRGVSVEELRGTPRGSPGKAGVRVVGQSEEGPFDLDVEVAVAHVGFRPDLALSRELQVHACYASEGPMKLAASLLVARVAAKGGGEAAGDCLKQAAPGPEQLVSPEPRFYVLGAKSYGRNSAFLLKLGHAQVEAVVAMLRKECHDKQ